MKLTLSLGELREATKDLPDDTELFVDEGDIEFRELRLHAILDPVAVLGHPAVVWLDMGQVWNQERDLDHRVDAYLGL